MYTIVLISQCIAQWLGWFPSLRVPGFKPLMHLIFPSKLWTPSVSDRKMGKKILCWVRTTDASRFYPSKLWTPPVSDRKMGNFPPKNGQKKIVLRQESNLRSGGQTRVRAQLHHCHKFDFIPFLKSYIRM